MESCWPCDLPSEHDPSERLAAITGLNRKDVRRTFHARSTPEARPLQENVPAAAGIDTRLYSEMMRMSSQEFLRPRLRGARFDGTEIPLEVLRDLAVLEEMLIEVAKWRFLQEHSDRQRSPRRFSEDVELRLTAVDDGSAVPVLALSISSTGLPGLERNLTYYEQAREAIVSAIGAAEKNRTVTEYLPERALSYFDRLGRSLREGESIEFTTVDHPGPARLNRETRRKLVLASPGVQELTEEVAKRGMIPEVDQAAMSFQVQLYDGRRIRAPLAEQHLEVVLVAFNGYRDGVRVLLQGIGRHDRQGRLQGFESVEHITPLDPLDVAGRLDEFRNLQDGWLDGHGRAPGQAGLDWLTAIFDQHFPDDLQLPYLYPTPEGGIQAEWSLPPYEISVEINLADHRAAWHRLNLATDEEETRILALDASAEWGWLSDSLRQLPGVAA